ncbi:MAG: hypothetical protein IPG04_27215 [Polyangiaceae bacterium]|nr:hypothetical protein [Polyangiaceae bacterium]
MNRRNLLSLFAAASITLGAACAPSSVPVDDEERADSEGKAFTSAQATLVTLEIDGELTAPWQTNTTKLIKTQLFYTVGQLNAHDSVGRLDRVVISDVKRVSNGDGWMKVTYRAELPVGWGSKTEIPDTLSLTFPRKIGPQSLKSFTASYGGSCVEDASHAVSSDNFWYHFRPEAEGCELAAADAVTVKAGVEISPMNTSAKYPEYDRVWADDELNVVAVFGKYEDYATSSSDAGIRAYDDFVEGLRAGVASGFGTTPSSLAARPGVSAPDVTFSGSYGGRTVNVTALLIDSPKVATAAFDARYGALTKKADLIVYDGHAGLGANVKALSTKGQFVKGRHSVFFFNGCDTFAYLDDTIAKRFAALNADDPNGTKYADVLSNLMPAYFHSMPDASLALIDALAMPDAPQTYEAILSKIDPSQVVVATGEEDNTFLPDSEDFDGISASNVLGRGQSHAFETPVLAPGTYVIRTVENGDEAGDVDLYVGLGYAPSVELYDFRPYLSGSNEEIRVELEAPTRILVMVHGYEDAPVSQNHYRITVVEK